MPALQPMRHHLDQPDASEDAARIHEQAEDDRDDRVRSVTGQ
jgi:hypothetical protein